MAYGLSFSDDFFLDTDPDAVRSAERPTSVFQAILSLQSDQWDRLAREVFRVEPDLLVYDRLEE